MSKSCIETPEYVTLWIYEWTHENECFILENPKSVTDTKHVSVQKLFIKWTRVRLLVVQGEAELFLKDSSNPVKSKKCN